MSIRWQIVILLSAVSAVFLGTTYLVQREVILPGFTTAERGEAEDDLARCEEALQRDGEHLLASAGDWAGWDDTYRYVQDRNTAYEIANFLPAMFVTNRINLLAVLRLDGELVWGRVHDRMSGDPVAAPALLKDLSRKDHPLLNHPDVESAISGVLMTELGPMLVASRPILTSENLGPIRGTLIMGRLLDAVEVEDLSARTRVPIRLWSIPGGEVPEADRSALSALTAAASPSHRILNYDASLLYGYALIRDVRGEPGLLLRADLPRTITQRGLKAARAATMTSLAGGLAVVLAVWLHLKRSVITPLMKLTAHAVRVGAEDDLRARLNSGRKDEIGILSGEFDRMVGRLAASREEMVRIAHRSGMATVAAEVLHNVGNVLNSVTVSAHLIADKLHRSEVGTLTQAAKLMVDQGDALGRFLSTDERGRQLPACLAELAKCLTTEQKDMLDEMNRLAGSIEHIRQIVNSQEARSVGAELLEAVPLAELVDEAVRLNAESPSAGPIDVVGQVAPECAVRVNRHKVLQILTNLISNAKNAMQEAGRGQERIVLKLEGIRDGGGARVRISVIDTGIGIAPENLTRIFALGFSTRPGGHGYGLHSAANMAKELGGSLTAASEGSGRGAVFTLELPMMASEVPQ